MAFHNARISVDVERGAVGGPRFNTTVHASPLSAKEVRAQNWSQARNRWEIGYGVNNRERAQELVAFFLARRGRLHSFRFRDWSDYQAQRVPFARADGTETEFQLTKTYGRGTPAPYVRKITKPVDGTVSLETGRTSSMGLTFSPIADTAYAIDYLTGIVTFTAAPATADLYWSGEFDVPVRFESDDMELTVIHVDAMHTPSIGIIQVDE